MRDEDGKVKIGLRNFTTKKTKKGTTEDALFSKPSYICTGDPYQSRSTTNLREASREGWKKAGHELNFKLPRALGSKVVRAPYVHMSDRNEMRK